MKCESEKEVLSSPLPDFFFFFFGVVVVVRRKEVEVERCGRRTKLRARASLSSVCVSNRRSETEEGERERERERRGKGKRERTRTYTPEIALKCIGGALRPHTHARLKKDGSVAGDFTQGESVANGDRSEEEEKKGRNLGRSAGDKGSASFIGKLSILEQVFTIPVMRL